MQDLQEESSEAGKLREALAFNAQFKRERDELREKTRRVESELNAHVDDVERQIQGLSNLQDELRAESESYPPLPDLEGWLDTLKREYSTMAFGQMDPQPFIDIGILNEGEGMDDLAGRIAEKLRILASLSKPTEGSSSISRRKLSAERESDRLADIRTRLAKRLHDNRKILKEIVEDTKSMAETAARSRSPE
jgi:flagellar hook-associated protein FlgK